MSLANDNFENVKTSIKVDSWVDERKKKSQNCALQKSQGCGKTFDYHEV
jgi:hypothetical protein